MSSSRPGAESERKPCSTEPRTLSHDQTPNVTGCRSNRLTDGKLSTTSLHRRGEKGIEPYPGQQRGSSSKQRNQNGAEARTSEFSADEVAEGHGLED